MANPVNIIVDSLVRFLSEGAGPGAYCPSTTDRQPNTTDSPDDTLSAIVRLALSLNGSNAEIDIENLSETLERIPYLGNGIILRCLSTVVTKPSFQANAETVGTPFLEPVLRRLDLASMTPPQKVHYAEILARLGRFDEAKQQIAEAYEADETMTDAYARIGWNLFWHKKEYDKAIEWMELDLQSRMEESCVRA
jgi:tetratricopeptide (TPR) repeat protein